MSGALPPAAPEAGPTLDSLPVAIALVAPDGSPAACNRAFRETYGSSAASGLTALLATSRRTHREGLLTRLDGEAVEVSVQVGPYEAPGAPPGTLCAVIQDMSATRRAERDLEEADQKLQEACRTGRLGYWEYGIRTGELVWNEEAFAVYGQDPATFRPGFDAFMALLHPTDRKGFGNMLESVVNNPKRVYVEYRVTGADGRTRYVSSSCAPRFDEQGRLSTLFGIALDTTDRAETAVALAEAKQRLEEAHKTGRLGYWEYGIRTGQLSWNEEAYEIHGQDLGTFQLSFDSFLALLLPEDRPRFGNQLESVIGDRKRVYFQYRVTDPSGELRYVSSSCAPRFAADGRLEQVFGIMIETTEQARAAAALEQAKERAEKAYAELKSAQDQLVMAEKMASLGMLVAGMAHEINTPTGVALSTASHLAAELEETSRAMADGRLTKSKLTQHFGEALDCTRLLISSTQRIDALVQSFKQVAEDQDERERRVFDLRSFIDSTIVGVCAELRAARPRIEVECPDGLDMDSYPGALGRTLAHLLRNAAIHAFPAGAPGHVLISVVPEPQDTIAILVGDDGSGIAPADLHRIFDPFFTTARNKGCIGLGLHMAYNLVTRVLGGDMTVQSRPGEGSSFWLRLPRSAPMALSDRVAEEVEG
ncbi:MAG TPA: PAS domain-containing protein [Azospirillaceae bacterium]|nr:PAS domain-containing protein [Azospirillaceae bacterium]